MTGVFLQVRLSSTRLPEKALSALCGKTVIEHAMLALRNVRAERHVLLTDEESAPQLAPYASRVGFSLFVGDPEDVLCRFADAADWFGIETVVRATGDNPLVSAEVVERTLAVQRERRCDYAALTGGPLGTGVEVVQAPALARAAEHARDPYDREHVTPFLYRNRERFRVCVEDVPSQWYLPEARVTLDTPDDYRRLEAIFEELYTGSPIDISRLVSYLSGNRGASAASHRHSA